MPRDDLFAPRRARASASEPTRAAGLDRATARCARDAGRTPRGPRGCALRAPLLDLARAHRSDCPPEPDDPALARPRRAAAVPGRPVHRIRARHGGLLLRRLALPYPPRPRIEAQAARDDDPGRAGDDDRPPLFCPRPARAPRRTAFF